MRDIKFRAWNKEKNIMCYEDEDKSAEYLDGWIASDIQAINQTLNSDYVKKRYDFMQYTGLHDKNGKEIYEGDIVGDKDIKWVIKWNLHRMGFSLYPTNERSYDEMPINVENKLGFEILGNIYDNPDLLEKGA